MKRMKKYLSMAALALVGAVMTGCSNNDNAVLPVSYDNVQQPVNNEKIVTLKTTISIDNNNATTRALAVDFDQKKAIKTFAEGDKIAISYYSNTSGEFVKAVSEPLQPSDITNGGKNATFTVTLDNPDKTKAVSYVYPAAMLNDALTPNYDALYNDQDGTLTKLGSTFDYCLKQGDWVGENLPSLTLENRLAILAITLKNADGSSDINNTITSMVVSDGANAYTVNRTAAEGPIYVAILPTSGATISVTATDGSKNYTKTLTDKTYAASSGYNVSWRMTPAATDLSMLDCAGLARASRWTANCYMVHTAGDYKLPLVYGNAIKDGETNATAYTGVSGQLENFTNHAGKDITDPWIKNNKGADDNNITVATAELLWQDAEGLITAVDIIGDYLTLTVGKDADTQEGNAVVAAKDGDGTIVWSWHIWVTKQTFANLTTVNTGSHTYQLTPVNLGWVGDPVSQGYNTFYQWGRKDAFFPGTGTDNTNHTVYNISNAPVTGLTYVQDNNNTITIADNIKNPTTFYNVSDNYKPNTSTAFNLWDAQQTTNGKNIATATVKTVYDPCPAGFCVPTGNLYYYITNGGVSSAWDGTNKGRTLTSVSPNVFFPASGIRNNFGNLNVVGSSGYYWSASPGNSYYGRYFYFYSSKWLWDRFYRAFGFPVRPVAEE